MTCAYWSQWDRSELDEGYKEYDYDDVKDCDGDLFFDSEENEEEEE